jgi:hypothetical protein
LSPRATLGGWRLVTGLLGIVVFVGLALAVLVLSQSSLDVRSIDAAAIDGEFVAVRQRFSVTHAYITVVRNGHVMPTVHHELEQRFAARIKTLRGLAWDPASARRGRLVRSRGPSTSNWISTSNFPTLRPLDQVSCSTSNTPMDAGLWCGRNDGWFALTAAVSGHLGGAAIELWAIGRLCSSRAARARTDDDRSSPGS